MGGETEGKLLFFEFLRRGKMLFFDLNDGQIEKKMIFFHLNSGKHKKILFFDFNVGKAKEFFDYCVGSRRKLIFPQQKKKLFPRFACSEFKSSKFVSQTNLGCLGLPKTKLEFLPVFGYFTSERQRNLAFQFTSLQGK